MTHYWRDKALYMGNTNMWQEGRNVSAWKGKSWIYRIQSHFNWRIEFLLWFGQYGWSKEKEEKIYLWDSILKSRNITLPTKVRLVKAMVFPVVMYGCESWNKKKVEQWRIGTFELWCWRRLLRIPWTARISNWSILEEINLE